MEEKADKQIEALNEELLQPGPDPNAPAAPPKRNTKAALIERILEVAESNNLELTVSNTQLRRMNKTDLHKLLASLVEEGVKERVAASVGAKDTSERSVALATLKMVHNTLAMATEHGINCFLPSYGYQVDGFTESLQHPVTSKAIDDCLLEIADTSPDLLQYIESPYSRLAIAWGGALAVSVRKKREPIVNNYGRPVAAVGPRPPRQAQAVRDRPRRGQEARQVVRPAGPPGPNGPKPV